MTREVAVVPIATRCDQDQEPTELHCRKGQGAEEEAGKTDIGTKATTAIENAPTIKEGEALIPQVQIIPFPVSLKGLDQPLLLQCDHLPSYKT